MSRENYPKQLLKLSGENSLFQSTFLRLEELIPQKNILTVTGISHADGISKQLKELTDCDECEIIGEPVGRNTAPAIGLAALYIQAVSNNPDSVILVTPSDQLIADNKAFINAVKQGIKQAEDGHIVTFGIKPTKPETGYGYIKTEISEEPALKVQEFKEKPDSETAKEYLASGNYFWNAGIFMFKASTILAELQTHSPEIINGLKKLDLSNKTIDKNTYQNIPSISIDYAVMEKSGNIVLIPADCGWNDLGSWEAVYETSGKDSDNNVIKGNVISTDSKNCCIFGTSKEVAVIGAENLVIIETPDAILVCDKSRTQEVKTVFDKLKRENNPAYLKHSD